MAILWIIALIPTAWACQCETGDYWCSMDDRLRETYNCSGSDSAIDLYNSISGEEDPENCDMLGKLCDIQPIPSKNATCNDECYDWCWRKPVGDCADMDDEQIFCVSQCMNYCVIEFCTDAHPWDDCQERCGSDFMDITTAGFNFIDYAICMGKCSPVPISPWGLKIDKSVSIEKRNRGRRNITLPH